MVCLSETVYRFPIKESRYNIKRAKWKAFFKYFELECRDLEWSATDCPQIEEMAEHITMAICKADDKSIPKKKSFRRSVPWWNEHLTGLKRGVNRARRRRYQREIDPLNRLALKREYARARRGYSSEVTRSKSDSWKKFMIREGNREMYGVVYRLTTKLVGPEDVLSGMATATNQSVNWEETAGVLLDSLIPDCELPVEAGSLLSNNYKIENEDGICLCTCEEVWKVIRNLPKCKAPGEDLIEAQMIKSLSRDLNFVVILRNLHNRCFKLGVFPKVWKRGLIRVFLKFREKDPCSPKSYRPICLLPFLGKMLEKLIKTRLEPYLLGLEFASPRQYGYRPGRSTVGAISEARRMVGPGEVYHGYPV